jgi:acetyltransferase
MDLKAFLRPQSVAVIGASRDPQKVGAQILNNLIRSNFQGKIYPINPKATSVQGLQTYASLSDFNETVDLAIIAIPQPFVLEAVDSCITKKVGSIIIITAGFKETGAEGKSLEQEIANKCKKANIPVLGPNCLGLIIPSINLNASFGTQLPKAGNVSFISQSGAFGTAVIDWAQNNDVGFSLFASLGNKAVLNENHFLQVIDSQTKVQIFYLEDIVEGRKFLELAREVVKKIPILILKPGRTKKAQQAAQSHTGALTGQDDVVTTALDQAGVIRLSNTQELFDLTKAFSLIPELAGNKVAIITNAGGPSIIATDAIETAGLELAPLSQETQGKLAQYLPRESNLHDPVDLIGDAKAERYKNALDHVLKDSNVDACIVLLTPQTSTEVELTAQYIADQAKKTNKPILAAFLGGTHVQKGLKLLSQNNILAYHYPEQAVNVLSRVWEYKKKQKQAIENPVLTNISFVPNPAHLRLLNQIKETNRNILKQDEIEELLTECNIKFPSKKIITSAKEAWTQAEQLITPVVMKISSPNILHKSDSGAVVLNLFEQDEVMESFENLSKILKKANDPTGFIYIQKQIPKGIEILLGVKRDPVFGPVVVVGTGGIFTEVYKDVASGIAPLTKNQAKSILEKTKIFQILSGARGQTKYDIDPVIQAIMRLSNLATSYQQISEIDLNPVTIINNELIALDARVILG